MGLPSSLSTKQVNSAIITNMNGINSTSSSSSSSSSSSIKSVSLEHLHQVCDSMRFLVKKTHEEKHLEKEARLSLLLLMSELKTKCRETFLFQDEWKQKIFKQKEAIEQHQLKLHNLHYEKDYLLKEIKRCQGFQTKEMDKIEFEDLIPTITKTTEQIQHRQHLDRLTKELATRKALLVQLKQLKEQIDQTDAAVLTKQQFLDGLQMEVQKIEQVTKPLQEYMGIQVSSQLYLQQQASTSLSVPLYALYCELDAYMMASDSSNFLRLEIIDAIPLVKKSKQKQKKRLFPDILRPQAEQGQQQGQEPQAKRVASRSLSTGRPTTDTTTYKPAPSRSPSIARLSSAAVTTTDSTSTNDFTAEKVHALKPSVQKEEQEDEQEREEDQTGCMQTIETIDIWQTSEKAVQLDIAIKTQKKTTHYRLLFQYLPVLKVVTVQLKDHHPVQVLMNLFPQDDGLKIPNLYNHYKWTTTSEESKEKEEELSFPSLDETKARPYHWAQWIAGLFDGMVQNNSTTTDTNVPSPPRRPEPSVRNVMQQLLRRFVTYEELEVQLKMLSQKKQLVLSSSSSPISTEAGKTKLTKWTLDSKQSQTYEAIFESPKKMVYHVQVNIPLDYPVRPSTCHFVSTCSSFSSSSPKKKITGVELLDPLLKDIEMEVNAFFEEFVPKQDENFLVSHQLYKIQSCLDILFSSGGAEGVEGATPVFSFGRFRRGKDRRQAIVVDATTKELRHR